MKPEMNEEVVELRLKRGRKKGEQETLLDIVHFGSPGYWSIWFIQRTGTAQLTTVQIRYVNPNLMGMPLGVRE